MQQNCFVVIFCTHVLSHSIFSSDAYIIEKQIVGIPRPLPIRPIFTEDRMQPTDLTYKQPEPFKHEDPRIFEKPYIPSKPIPHSPKISPSSIPNPSPSVMSNKPMEHGYPNYNSYLYSIPGYSAFQPVSYPGVLQPSQAPIQCEIPKEYVPFPALQPQAPISEQNIVDDQSKEKAQTDFEEHFTPEIISASLPSEVKRSLFTSEKNPISVTSEVKRNHFTSEVISAPLIPDIKKHQFMPEIIQASGITVPDVKNNNFTPEIIKKTAIPDVKNNNFIPEIISVTTDVKENSFTPEITPVTPKSDVKKNNFTPEIIPPNVTPDVKKNHFTPEIISATISPEVKNNSFTSEMSPVTVTSEAKNNSVTPEMSPVTVTTDIKNNNFTTEISPAIEIQNVTKKHLTPEIISAAATPDIKNKQYIPEIIPASVIPDVTKKQFAPDIISATEIPDVTKKHFTPELIPATVISDVQNQTESKMSITSLTQGTGATVTIPSQPIKDTKRKPTERFSLKTSIPISKIDMKCVNNPPDTIYQNSITKKVTFNTSPQKSDSRPRVEIQSNIVIKSATKVPNIKPDQKSASKTNNSINTLINAAEAINKNESQFRVPEPKQEVSNELKEAPVPTSRQTFNPTNVDSRVNYTNKPPEMYNDQKNQILLIQNKPPNPKMLLTIQQQNPQVLLQRTNFDSKNLQAPSRLSNQNKNCKEEIVTDTSSKVVALKRLHQDNLDENDFENLITENQIYGNKIVVKEKLQGTSQEQDLRMNKTTDKQTQSESKNVMLQPNFVYLSNVQFPANLMMIKNNSKINQSNDINKMKVTSNENKFNNEVNAMPNSSDMNSAIQTLKAQNATVSKEIHVLKSSNVLQTLSNKSSKADLVIQTNQKVIMNPQRVYQMPTHVNSNNKLNQAFPNREYPKRIQQKEQPKQFDDRLYIACPYKMDSKLQPKIVITNITPKKVEEISSLDIYEKRKKLRRMKYLTIRDAKDGQKTDVKKTQDSFKNVITPDKMKAEIYKEFSKTKMRVDDESSESDSDYGENELNEYNAIIKEYSPTTENENGKAEFLAGLKLATREAYKVKELDIQERMLRSDAVASAYIAAGRLDCLPHDPFVPSTIARRRIQVPDKVEIPDTNDIDNGVTLHKKQNFLSQLKLVQVSPLYKAEYEKAWQEVLKERKRRDVTTDKIENNKLKTSLAFDTNGQLQIISEIQSSVNENNNLIKQRLDSTRNENNEDTIRTLAEKNFTELNRLSKMADRSVKLFSGQDTKKRDLNPGFDSENIQSLITKCDQNYPYINVPNIANIISLKSIQENQSVSSTQATSMDEPQNSASGLCDMFQEITTTTDRVREFGCQTEESTTSWPGIEAILKSYRAYKTARKNEVSDLQRRNTTLRVEGVHINRASACEYDKARALLSERRNLAIEENNLKLSLQRLLTAINVIRNS